MVTPAFYARLHGPGEMLSITPALASWDKAGSPAQQRSAAFIDDVHAVLSERLRVTPDPLALRLDVGLPSTVPLLARHDLDNYLFPLVPRLSERTGRQFVAIWATKQHVRASTVVIEQAVPAIDPTAAYEFDIATTVSASSTAYKRQVRDQAAPAAPLSGEGITLQLAFVVGPRRAWSNLWKPTIDALGSILGHDDGAGEWNARDGRITDLGLHCTIDPAAGDRVHIAVRASSASSNTRH